ncbi:MAG: hypothetical protein CL920_19310 [Deltaproteobacteria bacterium]|nr:hypothetical protein [Deltaproteobacteria bacterium]MBU50836.1 hypothetical protein [Deltaproteobacteria bacterium]
MIVRLRIRFASHFLNSTRSQKATTDSTTLSTACFPPFPRHLPSLQATPHPTSSKPHQGESTFVRSGW